MREISQLVVFRLDERRYALPLAAVERVVRAVGDDPRPGDFQAIHEAAPAPSICSRA